MTSETNAAVSAEDVCASYGTGDLRVPVLVDVSFEIPRGRTTAITGPSGSGKTTLLSLIGGLSRASSGRLVVNGGDITAMDRTRLDRYRRQNVGFVFQSFNLLPTLTAQENVEAGLDPLRPGRREAQRRARAALDAVGLSKLGHRFPHELSGGEQQRVAVARACAKEPPLLLADEPTGNLDEDAGRQVLDLLMEVAGAHADQTLIVVTHDPSVAARADDTLVMRAHGVRSA